MELKRTRQTHETFAAPLTKRQKVDPGLARIWESLADDNESVRLDAAYNLLTNQLKSHDPEHVQVIAKRLFRGLCSGRKSARLGFYVALVGALSLNPAPFGLSEMDMSEVISILETHTTPEAETTGQDQRDHHFGRILGCKAIIESGALFTSDKNPPTSWMSLLDLLCKLMLRKPWLRPEAASVIRSGIVRMARAEKLQGRKAIIETLETMKEHRLLRTIDGLGIWLTAQDVMSDVKLPRDIWSSGHPLNEVELKSLKRILLDIRTPEDHGEDVSGTSLWSPKINQTWILILRKLDHQSTKRQLSFTSFWNEVVDNGLFQPSSTPERKLIGFLVLEAALTNLSPDHIPHCFSKNLMASMIQALKSGEDAYLQKSIEKVFGSVKSCSPSDSSIISDAIIEGLLKGSGYVDFDALTKTRIIQSLFEQMPLRSGDGIGRKILTLLQALPEDAHSNTSTNTTAKLKAIMNIFQRAICQQIRSSQHLVNPDTSKNAPNLTELIALISHFVNLRQESQNPETTTSTVYDESTCALLQEKIDLMLEVLISIGPKGYKGFLQVVQTLHNVKVDAEASITGDIDESWKYYSFCISRTMAESELEPSGGLSKPKTTRIHSQDGLSLLIGLLLYDAYGGDTESIGMLAEVNSMAEDYHTNDKISNVADHVVDIVLSLSSKSSKMFRKMGSLIFEAFTLNMTAEGLQALRDVLVTKEGRDGQQQLFENGDFDLDDDAESDLDNTNSSSMDSVGSDVEIVDKEEEEEEDSGSATERSGEEDDEDADEDTLTANDEELNDLEKALASALGTRRLTDSDINNGVDDGSDTGSDSDMSDSEMMELDEKLAEVFRNQQTQASAQRLRKEEMKTAKENVVNLKNRAMDLVEIFLRAQQSRGLECIDLLSSLLELAKSTSSQQLAHRALEISKSYLHKSKGSKLPEIDSDKNPSSQLIQHLQDLHLIVASKEVTNAVIEVAGQSHILLCKLLIASGHEDVQRTVQYIGDQIGPRKDVRRKALQEFWSRYDAWASSLPARRVDYPKNTTVNGSSSTIHVAKEVALTGDQKKKNKKKKKVKA